MSFRSFVALLVLFLACGFQFFLGSAGIFVNLILAALIAFAFYFDWLELAVFVLFSVFVVNWEPAVSPAIVIFAAIPFVAYAFRRFFTWTPWAGVPIVTICSFIVFYLAIAPRMFAVALPSVLLDIAGSLVFGELVLAVLVRAER